jgi:hypothetical protein
MRKEDIESRKTEKGGYTRKQLAEWGVAWPPPKGWKNKLINGIPIKQSKESI